MLTILVTTDFSPKSKAGIYFALQMAAQTPCKLFFYNVTEIFAPTSWNRNDVNLIVNNEMQKSESYMQRFIQTILKRTNNEHIQHECIVHMGTDTTNMIKKYAQSINADYICMATLFF